MITYRSFRNWDPPTLVRLWNTSIAERGVPHEIDVSDLDCLVFSKPYFDPDGIILAEADGVPVGFVHAGFGANERGELSREYGVVAMLVVAPTHRRRGIARELVRRAEQYLLSRGSIVIYAGSMHPLDPFYLGLYGGSELPGILRSDAAAHQLFQSLNYRPVDECVVMQLPLERPVVLTDARARAASRRVEFLIDVAPPSPDWWSAHQYAAMEHAYFELRLKQSAQSIAHARGWEMYPRQKSPTPAVGIVDVQVLPEHRNQGFGTYLMAQILKHYRDNGLARAEVQTMARNERACRMYQRLGFQEVDRGVIYRAEPRGPGSSAAPDERRVE